MPTLRTTTAVRLARAAVVALLLLSALALPAGAAGTGGIEVTPVPASVDGKAVTAFRVEVPSRGEESVPFLLRNVEDGERSARIYTARVTRDKAGTLSLGEPDSSPYVSYPNEMVTLEADEVREETFTVKGGELDEDQLAAVVVEVSNGSIVQRASTLIYLERGRVVPLPLLLVVVAVALLTAVAVAVAVVGRRRRSAEQEAPPEPAENS